MRSYLLRKEESGGSSSEADTQTALQVLIHTPFSTDNFTEFANQISKLTVGEESIIDQFTDAIRELRINAFLSMYEEHSAGLWEQIQLEELQVYEVRLNEMQSGEPIDTALPPLPSEYGLDQYIAEDTMRDANSVYDTHEQEQESVIHEFLMHWLIDGNGELADAFTEMLPTVELIMHEFEEEHADMVANATTQEGADDAARTFADDAQQGRALTVDKQGNYALKSFEDIAGDANAALDATEIDMSLVDVSAIYARIEAAYIAVLPVEASNDICSEFAGNVYKLDDLDAIPNWPVHPRCPHETVFLFDLSSSDLSEAA